MSLIEINNLNLSFKDKKIFNNANFMLNKGDKMGLVGVNGAGKSTLLKIISGDCLADKGKVEINSKIKLGILDQQAQIKSQKTIFDYLKEAFNEFYLSYEKMLSLYEKMAQVTDEFELIKISNETERISNFLQSNNFYGLEAEIEKVADGLGIKDFGLNKIAGNLSGGQRAKVRLAKLLLEKPDVILLDEPTNFLDVNHIEWLEKYLNSFEGSYIVVSHDESFLEQICNCVCDIDDLTISRYNVSYKQFKLDKLVKKEQYEKSYISQQKKIEKLQDFISRNLARASTSNMAKSRQKQLQKMDIIEKPTEHSKPTFLFNYKMIGSKILLEVENLIVGYTNPILPKINITLLKGEKLAITGFNGIGKSTFLKTLAGKIPAINGNFKFATNIRIGYFEQENHFYDNEITPLQYILSEFPKLTENEARSALSRCGLKSVHLREKIKSLSGGEQSKIKLCYITLTPSNVLILDEPTNHLDKLAIEQLKTAIKKFDGCVLFVSHDPKFVEEVATKTLEMEKLLSNKNK